MAKKFELTAELNLQSPKNIDKVLREIQRKVQSPSVELKVKGAKQAAKDVNEVAKANRGLKKETEAATKAASALGKQLGSALKNVLRYDIARRVFYTFASAVEQGVKDAISFQREMVKISQVSGQTLKQLKGLQEKVTGLSTSLGVSSSSLVKTGLILKQTGLSVQDVKTAMDALAKTELAPTFGNIADTAETAVAAMRQFKLEAKDLEGLMDKINVVAGRFAIESEDIGVAIKRTGGAFAAAGGSIEELIALMTSVRSTTRETAETIATGFRTIFTRLQRPTTIKFLRQFGIELTNLEGQFIGPYEAVLKLNNAIGDLDPKDLRFSAIVEQLGGFRQVSKVIPLIKEAKVAQQAMNEQMDAAGSLAKDADTAQQALAIQMAKLREEAKALFRSLAEGGAFQALAAGAISFAKALTKIADAMAPLIPLLGLLAVTRGISFGKGFIGGLGKGGGGGAGNFMGFNRGGKVPGVGNTDSIPAMLTPGEFVVNKKAAQRMGFAKLHGINRLHIGGPPDETPEERHVREMKEREAYEARKNVSPTTPRPNTPGGEKRGNPRDPFGVFSPRGQITQQTDFDHSKKVNREKGFYPEIPTHRTLYVSSEKIVDNVGEVLTNINDNLEEAAELSRSGPASHLSSGKMSKSRRSPETVEAIRRQREKSRLDREAAAIGRTFHSGGKPFTPEERKMFEDREAEKQRIADLLASPGTTPPPEDPSKKRKKERQKRFGFASDAIGSGLQSMAINTAAVAGVATFAKQIGVANEGLADFAIGASTSFGLLKGIQSSLEGFGKAIEGLPVVGGKLSKGMQDRGQFGLLVGGRGDSFRKNAKDFEKLSAAREKILARRDTALDDLRSSKTGSSEFKEAAMRADLENKNFEAQEKRFKQAEKQAKEDEAAIKKSKAFTMALTVAAAALTELGSTIKQRAMADIEAGDYEGAKTRATAGGALQGGAQGAMAGAMVGGPLGAIIGGLGGAIYGATTAFLEAEKRINQVKFAESITETEKQLKSFNDGTLSANEGLSTLAAALLARKELLSELDAEERKANKKTTQRAAEAFVTGLGKDANSVEEFNERLKENAGTLITEGAVRYQHIRAVQDEITERLKTQAGLQEYAEAQREASDQIRRLKGIGSIISELNADVGQFGKVISAIGGAGKGVGQVGNLSSVFDNNPRSKGGIARFNEAITNLGKAGKSAGLDQFSGDVISATGIQRNLEESIASTLKTDPFGDDIKGTLLKNIEDSLKAEGTPLTETIRRRLDKALGSEITNLGDEQKEITDRINDAMGLTIEPFKNFGDLLTERNKFLKSALDQLFSLETSYINSIRKAQDTQVQAQRNFSKNTSTSNFGFESNKDVQARFFSRLDTIVGASQRVGGGTSADVGNVGSVIGRLQKVQDLIIKNEQDKLAADSSASAEQQEDLIRTGAKLSREFNTLQTILNEYGNSQQRLTALNERLQRSQQREDFIKGGIKSIAFGDSNTSAQTTRLFSAIQKAFNEGTLANIPSDIRQEVANILEDPKSPFGQKGADIVASDLSKIATSLGLAANAFTKTSKEREETSKEIEAIEKVAAKAFGGLASVEKTRIDSMATKIESQNSTFLQNLEQLFKEEQARTLGIDIANQKKILEDAQKVQAAVKAGNVSDEAFKALLDPARVKQFENFRTRRRLMDYGPEAGQFARAGTGDINDNYQSIRDLIRKILSAQADPTRVSVPGRGAFNDLGGRDQDMTLPGGRTLYTDSLRQGMFGKTESGEKLNRINKDAIEALEFILKMSGKRSLTFPDFKHGWSPTTTEEAGFTGANFNVLRDRAEVQFGKGTTATDMFTKSIDKIEIAAQGGAHITKTLQDISLAFVKAKEQQRIDLAELYKSDSIFSQLDQIPKEIRDIISGSNVAESIKDLESKSKGAADQLEHLRSQLESLTGVSESQRQAEVKAKEISKKKVEAEGRLQKEIDRQSALPAPAAPKFTGSINNPASIAAFNEARGIAENKARDAAARAERKRIAEEAAKAKSSSGGMSVIRKQMQRSNERMNIGGKVSQIGTLPGEKHSATFVQGKRLSEEELANLPPVRTNYSSMNIRGKNIPMFEQHFPADDPRGGTIHMFPELLKNAEATKNASTKLLDEATNGESLSVHDHHAVPILEEILLTLKGQGQTGTAGGEQNTLSFNTIDTTALDQSINTFSKSVTDLSEVMSSPITMEVGGEININVNMTGAEILQENEAAFAQIAGKKVTDGINNFIRNGLRTSNIAIKGDWT